MNPSHTPETTATFRSALPSLSAVASTSGAVARPRTTSSSRITFAGLKKWRPSTSEGRRVKPAMVFTSSVEVLVARMAPGFITRSSAMNTPRLTSMDSNTASITTSAWPMAS